MKATDSLDFAIMGLIYAVVGLLLGQPFVEAAGSAIRLVGLCTLARGAVDFLRWCRR